MSCYTGIQGAYGCANLKNTPWAYEGMKRSCSTAYPPQVPPDTSLWKVYTSDIYVPYNTLGETYAKKNETVLSWSMPK